jgi:hypothetical protein
MSGRSWLLLLYALPSKQGTQRVNLWRKLKRTGAISLKTSGYLLPDAPSHHEHFQWLAQQVRDAEGEATLIRVAEIEGFTEADLVNQFNETRAREYAEVEGPLSSLLKRRGKRRAEGFTEELEKLRKRFEEIRATDFFDSPKASELQDLLESAAPYGDGTAKLTKLAVREFANRTWLTRPRPEIDRVSSAWLIRRFIDPKARFVFAADVRKHPKAIPFDMVEGEFTHHGDDCTFETLVKRFGISDAAVRKIAEMVHDADLEDGKYGRCECVGLHQVLKGWALLAATDDEILVRGGEALDALYASLRKYK